MTAMNTKLVSFTFGLAAMAMACGGAEPQDNRTPPKPTGTVPGPTTPEEPGGGGQGGSDGEACVAEGAKGNALGIGAFCNKTSTRCKTGLICTADFDAPAGAHFCTIPCAGDKDCGDGAICYAEERGKGCVPNACVKK